MKKYLLLPILFCCIGNLYGQNKIRYSYDNAGNRTKREIVLTRNEAMEDAGSVEPFSDMISEHEIQIYPNPTEGDLNISISNVSYDNQISITLYDMNGKLIRKENTATERVNINISDAPNGIYIMQIMIDEKVTTWKIVKK
ncbi:T9SS type A sorting domain-containing protein [uncultured Bacteroides sp.]|uniref:T9SS type A sorting domain-containing protein n=1 Tax=uncultured Bacteroides sp. TaxID=162156 RepID=UPI0023C5B943|nr:T9SS type A sorting domain-containing protein [uncultured Bacteroides sp.]MDE5701545.1 T9SS type A sorting domain-containing protein [Bacteroides sp.]MDE6173652.1 T9SS type A sorting domain-containing protein [Bacteroides sp.]